MVAGKAYAWRLLGMLPSISKVVTVAQTESILASSLTEKRSSVGCSTYVE